MSDSGPLPLQELPSLQKRTQGQLQRFFLLDNLQEVFIFG